MMVNRHILLYQCNNLHKIWVTSYTVVSSSKFISPKYHTLHAYYKLLGNKGLPSLVVIRLLQCTKMGYDWSASSLNATLMFQATSFSKFDHTFLYPTFVKSNVPFYNFSAKWILYERNPYQKVATTKNKSKKKTFVGEKLPLQF